MVAVALLAGVLGALLLPVQAQPETEGLKVEFTSEVTRQTQPGLVVFILDHSGSMQDKRGVPDAYRGKTRWQASLEDAIKRIDSALKTDPGTVDVRVYSFDSEPAEYLKYRPFPRLTRSGGFIAAKAALNSIPEPYGATRLYTSVRNIAEGLVKDDALAAYGWVWVVMYSDGDDSEFTPTGSVRQRAAEASMCAALTELSKSPRVVIDYLPIGFKGLDTSCGGLRRTQLDEIKPPVVYHLNIEPDPLRLNGGKAGGTLVTPLKLKGFADPESVKFHLIGQPSGLELSVEGTDRLMWKLPAELSDGARFKLAVVSAVPESSNRISVTNDVTVPPMASMPEVSRWGLPEACPDEGGKRVLVVERGQPVVITPNLPDDAQVKWAVSPGDKTISGPNFRESLAVGTYSIRVSASRPNSAELSETVVAHVIEPVVVIGPSPNAPKEAVAGTDYPLLARLQGPPPPDYILKALEGTAGAWRVAGQRQETRGLTVTANFSDFGTMGVDFIAKVPVCRGFIHFRGSTTVAVKPGVSIRLIPTRLVQGYPGSISIEVSDRDQVDRVDVSIDGGKTWIAAQPDAQERLNATAKTPPIAAAELANGSRNGLLDVHLRPIRKLPSGLASSRDDVENIKRERKAQLPLVKPEVEVDFVQPLPGSDAPFDKLIPLEARVSGREGYLVKKVEIRMGSGTASPKLGEMVKGEETEDRAGFKWRSGGFKANATMPQEVQLVAEARDADGQRIGVGSVTVNPRSPRPILILAGTNQSTITWSGGPENVPTVVVKLVESGSNEPYPDSAVRSVKWQVAGALEMLPGGNDRSQSASLRPIRRGEARISATITSPSGVTQPPAMLEVKIDPAPLTQESLPRLRLSKAGNPKELIEVGPDFWVRGRGSMDLSFEGEVGAFASRSLSLIRAGATQSVSTVQGIPFARIPASWQFWRPANPVKCSLQVAWVPWGESKEQTIVHEAPFRAVAAPSLLQILVVSAVGLFFIAIALRMGLGSNRMLGHEVEWLVGDNPLRAAANGGRITGSKSTISVFSSSSGFNLLSKRARIRLPQSRAAIRDVPWLGEGKNRQDRVLFNNNNETPSPLSERNELRVDALPPHSFHYKITPRGGGPPVMLKYSNPSGPIGQGLRAFVKLSALVFVLVLVGLLIYLIKGHTWPTL